MSRNINSPSEKINPIDVYAQMGLQWVNGEIDVKEWELKGEAETKKIVLNPSQKQFVNSRTRFTLYSGGIGSGKTTALLLKTILLALWFPGNRILLGRRTRSTLEKSTLPDFFDLCPPDVAQYSAGRGLIRFFNGSEIILYGLDALQSGTQQDIRKAEQEIKSLNLGAVVIDQLEEIEERVFHALGSRLRRNVPFRQFIATTNPANYWAYDWFKRNPRPNTLLIENSTLENKANLPPDFLEDRLSYPESWKRRYIYGEWTHEIGSAEGAVFEEEYRRAMRLTCKDPIRVLDGIKIFEEPQNQEYQIGVDPSQGAVDPGCIKVISVHTGNEVASFNGFCSINALVEKTLQLAMMYAKLRKPLIVPEVNAAGVAFIEQLKRSYDNIYQREVFSYREQRKLKKLGFNTTHGTKLNLIESFKVLLKDGFPKIREKETVDEFDTFVYSEEARLRGAGAQKGFHDDRVMATLLAYWRVKPISKEQAEQRTVFLKQPQQPKPIRYQYL